MADIELQQGSIQSVQVSSEKDGADVQTRVNDNTLYVESGAGTKLTITLPKLESVIINGKGTVYSTSPFSGESLNLQIAGNGKFSMQLDVRKVHADIGGVGKIELSGKADEASFNVSGSGKVAAYDLVVKRCLANISGLGKCEVDVREELTSNISGKGSILYKSKPNVLKENISGLGKTAEAGTDVARDTTHLSFGSVDVMVIGKNTAKEKSVKKTKPLWGGLELGINAYMNSNNNFDLPPGFSGLELRQEKSVSVALNLLQKDFELGKSNIWFYTGLGVSWNNYRFDNNVSLVNSNPIAMMSDTSSSRHYEKSKLVSSYLTAPLMFQAFTSRNPKKAFHISAGALLGLRLGSHTKQKYEEDGKTYKPKTYDDFNLNPFRYGFRVAAGYGKFQVFADYYASTLFRDGKGPSLYPVNAGITLVGF